MADENRDWNCEGDIVRLIGRATEPVIRDIEEIIVTLDKVIKSLNTEGVE